MKRGSNGFGFLPISHLEIDAWQRITGSSLAPWELRALNAMDIEKLQLLNAPKDETVNVVSSRSMSPELFDALF
jgi:hypothetical protein